MAVFVGAMLSLFLRNLFFMILQPGLLAGVLPYYLVKDSLTIIDFNDLKVFHYVGILLFCVGVAIVFSCVYYFILIGNGTLSPADKTKKIVIYGLYRYSRNPMYLGILIVLLGEVIFTTAIVLCFYLVIVFIGFHFFVILKEEPRLKKDFGKEYDNYRLKVKRWF